MFPKATPSLRFLLTCRQSQYPKQHEKGDRGIYYDECSAVLRAILDCTFSQVFVARKLSSMNQIICSNLFIGIANVKISSGTQGRAEGSNIPSTARG
jgi:hypothetical protein